ncbi:hypothetical protein PoB_001263900 [Plakobranchus ocellatus]|uniref:Uncharacterized protein n=1 Tax=Plakobranchus ocellatus TaxID=259542 RepID=A0AAV3YVP9_9GAST|nr:hypothetical protein PoB_001263900 [Plakobranchus ocellatus]
MASLQEGDLRLSGPPSGQGTGGGARTYDERVPADLRADSLATVPLMPQLKQQDNQSQAEGHTTDTMEAGHFIYNRPSLQIKILQAETTLKILRCR